MYIIQILKKPIAVIWIINLLLGSTIAIREVWLPYMNAGKDNYLHIPSAPFNGTTYPIAFVPNWDTAKVEKYKKFDEYALSDFMPLPTYDAKLLEPTTDMKKKDVRMARNTYTVGYMGSYEENGDDKWGHSGVDIRAPIGTPVLSIANGIVVRTINGDSTWLKYVVVRHDGVPMWKKKVSIYSNYLHLSEINIAEGTLVKKWDMVGRVGMSGMATGPHLHLQIDTADAPFHPYWHFTTVDATAAGLSFYDGVSVGLGKDRAILYTIHPMAFIQMHKDGVSTYTDSDTVSTTVSTTVVAANSAPEKSIPCTGRTYSDIKNTTQVNKKILSMIADTCVFADIYNKLDTSKNMARRDMVIEWARYRKLSPTAGVSDALDVPMSDPLHGYLLKMEDIGYVVGDTFRPDDIATKGEMLDMYVRYYPKQNVQIAPLYTDVPTTDILYESAQQYAKKSGNSGKFNRDTKLTRQMFFQMVYNMEK